MAKEILSDKETLRLVQIFVAVPLLLLGAYMLTPWYVILTESAAFGTVASTSTTVVKLTGAFYVFTGLGTLYGGVFGNDHRVSKWMIWLGVSAYATVVATRLITIGFVPFIWTFQVALLLIISALALRAKGA
jgi:hypothetical protein